MLKQNPFWISELQNFILQVPANVPGSQDREDQMQKKKFIPRFSVMLLKKVLRPFKTILLQVKIFFFYPCAFE